MSDNVAWPELADSPTLPGSRRGRVGAFPPILTAAVVLAMGGAAAWMMDGWYAQSRLVAERQRVAQELAPYANGVTIALNRRMALLTGLRAFVEIEWAGVEFGPKFDAFAAALVGSAPGVRTVQVVERGVVRRTYPVAGNEAVVGYNVLTDPRAVVRADFMRAMRSDRVVLSGPLELVQGGLGLIGRQSALVGGERIAVVAVVLDLPPIFAEARLDAARGLAIALRDETGRVFFGRPRVFDAGAVEHTVSLPDRRWTIAAMPGAGWAAADEERDSLRIAAAGVALLLALSAYLIASRQAGLAAAVAERTASLTAANRSLEEQVSEREKVEAQLMHSQKMEGLGRLAGGIAHDFNNILTAILGYVSLLQDEMPRGTSARDDLDEIERASRRASDLTRQLLTFARKQAVAPKVINLNELIRDVERILRRLIGEDIEMVVDLEPSLWPVRADPTQLEQVLTNLVVNARDAMPAGGRVTIATRRVRATPTELGIGLGVGARITDFVQLEVKDTGSGMDAATAARVFEPFFTTKEPGRGTGLGLAISYGIVEEAGGAIAVTSEPGTGTTVTIHLPPASAPVGVSQAVKVVPSSSASETVLVVEDEALVRGLAERALAGRGYTVLTAPNGEEAMQIAREYSGHIALLVTDVIMPRAGGRVVAEQLSAARPGIKVLFISGHVDDPRVRDAIEARGAAFLPKPFTPHELAEAVRCVLDWGTASVAPTSPPV